MKARISLLALGLFGSCLTPAVARGLLDLLFPRHQIQVVTDSDVFDQTVPMPKPARPVYYLAISTGFHDFGAPIGGFKEPNSKDVLTAVTNILDRIGYKLATNHNAPEMIIVYGWGTLNADRVNYNPNMPTLVQNRSQIIKFLGGAKVGLQVDNSVGFPELDGGLPMGLSMGNLEARDFYEMGSDDYYVLALTAYAYDLKVTDKHKTKRLWSTRMSCPSLGHELAEVLPTMLSIGASHIGKQMTKPLIVTADEHYKANVELGPTTVVEEPKPVRK